MFNQHVLSAAAGSGLLFKLPLSPQTPRDSVLFYNSAHSWALRRLHLMRFSEGLQRVDKKNLIKNQPQPKFFIHFIFFRYDRSGLNAGPGCYAARSDRRLPRRANNRGVCLWRTINLVRGSDKHRNSEYKDKNSLLNNSPAEFTKGPPPFLITLGTLRLVWRNAMNYRQVFKYLFSGTLIK